MKPEIKLDCNAARELMLQYLDGECSEAERTVLEAHLSECGDCAAELEEQKKLLALIKNTEFAAPAGLYSSVMAAVALTEQDKPSWRARAYSRSGGTLASSSKPSFRRAFVRCGTAIAACAVIMLLVVGRGMSGADSSLLGNSEKLEVTGETTAAAADTTGEIPALKVASPMTTTDEADSSGANKLTVAKEIAEHAYSQACGKDITDAAVLVVGESSAIKLPNGADEQLDFNGKAYTCRIITDKKQMGKLEAEITSLEKAGKPFELRLPKGEIGRYHVIVIAEEIVK